MRDGTELNALQALFCESEAGGGDRYLALLREAGIRPTPADGGGLLFAPNPVVASRRMVEAITEDLHRFCRARLDETRDGDALASAVPHALRDLIAGEDISDRIRVDLAESAPAACIDCFLEDGDAGPRPAYLEWQTFPAYPATAVVCLEALAAAHPDIEARGGSFSPVAGETLADVRARITAWHVREVEDDPRQAVIVDLEPERQETSFEFDMAVRLTGGPEAGLGVIDPREIVYDGGLPCYRRNGSLVPVRSVFSRIVHADLMRLEAALSPEERLTCRRFFNDVERVSWRVHPLHFLWGTKGDLPRFADRALSPFIPACETVTPETIARARRAGRDRLDGRVQKPIEGHGGRDVLEDPSVDDLEEGALLQRRIEASACHPTRDGMMTPELRVMGLPGADGRLECAAVYTRVKSPDEFRSNAGAIAKRNRPGTGEGFAIFID